MTAIPAWQRELFARRTYGVRMGLDVVREAHALLGRPASAIPAVHVVGTNGKGSTAAMVAHGLRGRGRRVGLYTSPHLHRVGERVQIDGEALADEALREEVDAVLAVDRGGALERPLTFFEILTLAALRAFERREVEIAVVECGLGGRLDATRLASAVLTLFTPIAIDHVAFLGPDLAAIAGEKAAVLEGRSLGLSAPQAPEAAAVLRRAAAAAGAELRFVEPAPRAPQGLAGAHQRVNAGLALAALGVLEGAEAAAIERLDGVRWPGRLEAIERGGGRVLLDVAHNLHGIEALAEHLRARPEPAGGRLILFGCMGDKEGPAMAAALASVGAPLLLVPPGEQEGWSAAALAAELPPGVEIEAAPTLADPRVDAAIERRLAAGGEVVICGSCYLVGALRGRLLGAVSDPLALADPLPRRPGR
ncbi:MAG: bifunctional folylpolyglutamate synthase/dihydrofolate synthase [Myxococcales bacterium]|nr:bifunctional folylpolyglutamate synthase/dihydrofolate synthase [Myxococcales bacterium]